MGLQITFDTATISPAEVAAIRSILDSLAPRPTIPAASGLAVPPAPTSLPPMPAPIAATATAPDTSTATPTSVTAAAPVAPMAAPPAPVAASAEPPAVDSRGLPWDARIHSEKKGLNADGTWRNRRGVQPLVRSQVEAALMAAAGNALPSPAAPVAATAPPAPVPHMEQRGPVQTPGPVPAGNYPSTVPTAPAPVPIAAVPAAPVPPPNPAPIAAVPSPSAVPVSPSATPVSPSSGPAAFTDVMGLVAECNKRGMNAFELLGPHGISGAKELLPAEAQPLRDKAVEVLRGVLAQ